MKPDIIVSWPIHLDFPLWRQFIHDHRDHFAKVIVVFTQMNTGQDYRAWLREELSKDGIISIDNDQVSADQDWRNLAVNKGLSLSDAEWVWFTEQDFFPQERFWNAVQLGQDLHCEVFGYFQLGRLHPCCIFIKRSLLDSTSKNFGIIVDKLDHFGILQRELDERNINIGIIHSDLGEHLNGLSQNMWLLSINHVPNHQPEKLKEYFRKCLALDIPIHPQIREMFEKYVSI